MDARVLSGNALMSHQSVIAASGSQSPPVNQIDSLSPTGMDCSRDPDFGILFEESVFSIVPSLCFIILAVLRVLVLRNRKEDTVGMGSALKFGKLVSGHSSFSLPPPPKKKI